MFVKLVMSVLVIAAVAFVADHYGYIDLPVFDGSSPALDARDKMINKTGEALGTGSN